MSTKAVPDPGAVGWEQDPDNPDFWTWEATGNLVEEAPEDGAQYGRESKAWTEIVVPEVPEFVETDPTVPDHVKAISTDDIANWSASYSWEDHSLAGYATMMWVQSNYQSKGDYLTDFTETDPVFTASPAAGISESQISEWDSVNIKDGYTPWSIGPWWNATSGAWEQSNKILWNDAPEYAIEFWPVSNIMPMKIQSNRVDFSQGIDLYQYNWTVRNGTTVNAKCTHQGYLEAQRIRSDDYQYKNGNPIMRTLTQAEYNALTPNAATVYFIV